MLTPIDARHTKPREGPVKWRRLRYIAGNTLVASMGWFLLEITPPDLDLYPGIGMRWATGICFFLSIPNLLDHCSLLFLDLLGHSAPSIHRQPYLSLSLSEFWNRRWNLMVAGFGARYIFLPIARRRRPTLAVWAVFSASALLHLWLGLVTAPWTVAIPFALYFIFQAPFTLLERRLELDTWPHWARRMWTYLIILGPSPMITEWLIPLMP